MTNDQLSGLCMVIAGLAICAGAAGLGVGSVSAPDSGFMPLLAGAGMALLGTGGFAGATFRRRRGERWVPLFAQVLWQRGVMTLASLAVYAVTIRRAGFLLGTAVLTVFLLRCVTPQRWAVVLIAAFAMTGGSFLVFDIWLNVPLPKGVLGF